MGWWWKWNKKKRTLERGAMLLEDLIECCDGKSNPIKFFSADEIRKATNNFSKSNRVYDLYSLDYKWYSGKNENHPKILIKKFDFVTAKLCCRDIAVSSVVSGHKNFLKLVGCCLEFQNPVMVYHGVKKHNKLYDLSEHPWKRRLKIAEDIATAFAYLHTAFPRPFVYRCMRLSSILLDEDGVAKLIDFSFCVSIPEGETFVKVDSDLGTYDLFNYSYLKNGIVSEKTDVFAFGTLMQRLLMGGERFWEIWSYASDKELKERFEQEEKYLLKKEADGEGDNDDSYDSATMSEINYRGRCFEIRLSKFKEERRLEEIADPKMLENMGEISEKELCQMKAFRMLSLRCIDLEGEVPTMVEVVKELKKIQKSLRNDSSAPSGETQTDSAQDISSSVVLSNKT